MFALFCPDLKRCDIMLACSISISLFQADSAIRAALLNILCAAWAQELSPLRCVSEGRIDYCDSLAIAHWRLPDILGIMKRNAIVPY